MAAWQVQEAKSRLSEVIERAQKEGPQTITRHGKPSAIVLSVDEYEAMKREKPDFKDWLFSGPKIDDFEIERSKDTGREIDLE
jgi:prevent-host-death family protein